MTTQHRSDTSKQLQSRAIGPILTALLLITAAGAQADIPYTSGGVGLNSQEELIARQKEFSLKLVFAEKQTGSYLANVEVTIADTAGETLVNAVSDGPWFYAKLPAGSYKVTATFHGIAQSVAVKVPATGLKEQYLRWDPSTDAL
jgi:hypothetical protein